jgi:hypothetical protein
MSDGLTIATESRAYVTSLDFIFVEDCPTRTVGSTLMHFIPFFERLAKILAARYTEKMKKPTQPGSVKVVPFPKGEKVPPEIVESLELALKHAKEGTLEECVLSFTCEGKEGEGPCSEDGHPLLPVRKALWRKDGRLDATYAELSSMAFEVMLDLTGRG